MLKKQPFWQYEQISNELIRQIESGELEVESKLPSEKQLGEEYQVSRITVRKALAELEEKKYIEKRQGQGSFVRAQRSDDIEISYVDNPSVQLRNFGHSVYIEVQQFQVLVDGEEPNIRKVMQIGDNEYLYKINQIYFSDREPLIQRTTYLLFEDYPMIKINEIQNCELMPMLVQRYNLDPKLLHHEISTSVDQIPSRLKGLPSTAPRKSYVETTTTYVNEEDHISYISTAIAPSASKVFFLKQKLRGGINMSEPHILLTRIDNRLVHGQVGVTWTKTLGANLILVANDASAEDTLQQKLMKSTADSSGAQIRFFTLQKTMDVISKAADRQKIFIVVKTPEDVLTLVEGGVPIKEVNVGNMHFAPGKEEVTKKVYVDQADKDALMGLVNKGLDVYIQDVPGEHKTPINF